MRIGILSIPSRRGNELPETKKLVEEIENAQHEPSIINYRKTCISITEKGRILYHYSEDEKKLEPIEIDAVIPRIGSYQEAGRLALTTLILNGVVSVAQPEAIAKAKNKIETQILLDKEGIPTPYGVATLGRLPENSSIILRNFEPNPKQPLIIKTKNGSHGKGVMLGTNRASARSIVDGQDSKELIIQEFIEAPEKENFHSDIRLVVVEGQVIASMRRRAENIDDEDEFRANLSLGGHGEIYDPTPREKELAIKATETIGLQVAGVDIMPSKRGPLVIEVNPNLELGIEEISKVNIAREIVNLAIRNATLSNPQINQELAL